MAKDKASGHHKSSASGSSAAAEAEKTSSIGGNASKSNDEPQLIIYQAPFPLTGKKHTEGRHTYTLADKADCYTFRNFADSLDGFSLQYNKKNEVMVWSKKVHGEPMHIIKVFGVFAKTKENPNGGATPAELYDMLQDAIFREEWDNFRQEAFRIVKMDEKNDIGYYAAKSPMSMVASRDFVNQRMWHDAGRGEYVIFNTSVQHDRAPPTYQKDTHHNKYGSYVRAVSKVTGYLIRPWVNKESGEAEGSCLTYVTQSDPCGWIPPTLTNYIATKFAPNTIRNVTEAIPKFRVWFKAQMESGKYEKDWQAEPEWWTTEDGKDGVAQVPNETIDAARQKWSEEKKSKK